MKMLKFSGSVFIGSIAVAVIFGCGGGGGVGKTPSTIDAAGIQEVAARFVTNGMCTEVGGGVTGSSSSVSSVETSSAGNSSSINSFSKEARYTSTYYGALGGQVDIGFEHKNGVDTYSYDFMQFDNPIGGSDVTLDGKAERINHGKPTDYGPVYSNMTAQTNGPISATVGTLDSATVGTLDKSRSAGDTLHYDFELQGYNRVYATTFGDPDKITVTSASMIDTDKDKKYSVTNVKMDGYITSTDNIIQGLSATYNDADHGTIKVTQESESISVSVETSPWEILVPTSMTGSVELEGTDGTKGSLEVDGSSVKIYTKDANGQKTLVSDLNCRLLMPEV